MSFSPRTWIISASAPINGDRIYNGAMDNASGSAMLLDVPPASKAHEKFKRRFCSWYRRGKGTAGLRYFAPHPTVRQTNIVADLNADMFLPIVPLKILTWAAGRTDLGERAPRRSHEVTASKCIPIRSRCATYLSAAINTASSSRACPRWP